MMAALATAAMTLGELFGSAAGNISDLEVVDLVPIARLNVIFVYRAA